MLLSRWKKGGWKSGQNYVNLKRDKNALFVFPKPCPSPTNSFLGQAVSGNIFWLKTFAEFQEFAPQILRLLCSGMLTCGQRETKTFLECWRKL